MRGHHVGELISLATRDPDLLCLDATGEGYRVGARGAGGLRRAASNDGAGSGMDERERRLDYATYLKLDRLLSCQELESAKPRPDRAAEPVHDEHLFIIVHQAYELWFRQILWELDAVLEIFGRDTVSDKSMGRLEAHLRRIVEIQKILLLQVDVLETMTPLDFLDFRDLLTPASGIESLQFRLIENKLGVEPARRVRINEEPYTSRFAAADREKLEESERRPSLLALVDRWLARTPFLSFGEFDFWREYRSAVERMLEKERARIEGTSGLDEDERRTRIARLQASAERFEALFQPEKHEELVGAGERRFSQKALLAALLINLYRDEPILHLPYRLLTLLMDIDEGFTNWRQRHALMVSRMIGTKMGTGGTPGTEYLRRTAEKHKVFTDLFHLSTYFIRRSELPRLPPEVERTMSFQYTEK
jgi:tryptophan 2,3-dioxygenase